MRKLLLLLLLCFAQTAGAIANLTFKGLKPSYSTGEKIVVDLDENLGTPSRSEKVDLWVAIELPNHEFLFLIPEENGLFSSQPLPFRTSLEMTEQTYRVLELEIPPGLAGQYVFYALYVKKGKNPMTDGFVIQRSNLAMAEMMIHFSPPVADFTFAPSVARNPETGLFMVHLEANLSSDPDGGMIGDYEWLIVTSEGYHLKNDKGQTIDLSLNECGEYKVTLTVTDDEYVRSSTTKPLTVNCPPVPQFVIEPPSVDAPLTIVLDGSQSVDPDGNIVEYQWKVCPAGDKTGPCKSLTHHTPRSQMTFEGCGVYYTVNLTVIDDRGASSSNTQGAFKINNCLPKAVFTPRFKFGHLPVNLTLDGSHSCDTDGHITHYEWNVEGCELSEKLFGPQPSITLTEECIYQITLTVTDDDASINTTTQTISTVPYNDTARAYPQIIAAGISPSQVNTPSQVNNTDALFDIVALIRPSIAPLYQVSFQTADNLSRPMTLSGVLPNGDEVYKFAYRIPLDGTVETSITWGPAQGQFNIIAIGEDRSSCEDTVGCHIFSYLRVDHLPAITPPLGTIKQEVPITYNATVRHGPQVVMAGYSPGILRVSDDQFDIIAVVRAGALPIEQVIWKHGNNPKFTGADVMTFIGELDNGDKVYKTTISYPPGILRVPPGGMFVSHKDIWGPSTELFDIVVYDQGGNQSHKFSDIKFGTYPEWDKSVLPSCDLLR
jgi:PKD repeat protein